MKVLFFGDIFGRPGRSAVQRFIESKKQELDVDLVIGNADNISSGKGPIKKTYDELIGAGVDILTCGDHIWDNKDVAEILGRDSRLLRPLNYPDGCPGLGSKLLNIKGRDVLVASILGRVFTIEGLNSPFVELENLINESKTKTIIVDFHAEATSEKVALSNYFAGRVSAILGTHTHVQTADEKIISGTALISDAGMCGPSDSVIGVNKEQSIKRFLTAMPVAFEVGEGPAQINAVLLDIDEDGMAVSIERINEILS